MLSLLPILGLYLLSVFLLIALFAFVMDWEYREKQPMTWIHLYRLIKLGYKH
jgi:hypothetical protein